MLKCVYVYVYVYVCMCIQLEYVQRTIVQLISKSLVERLIPCTRTHDIYVRTSKMS